MATIRYENASRIYEGVEEPAVNSLNLESADGELLVLVGPSGSGKSTALRMLAGLEPCDKGSVHIGDRDVTLVPPRDRDIAMVFQFYALYPHLTGRENIGYPLRAAGVPKAEAEARIDAVARTMRLDGLLQRKPNKLSGGEQQRIALARAMVREPQAFLLDEPLTGLDLDLRMRLAGEIAGVLRATATTSLWVTHDAEEAAIVADRVVLLGEL